jgi:BirA family biotin operon repressor/biotin-[acetyl-CoA-carboxylase] ligase
MDTDLLVRETFARRAEHYATVGSTNDLARQWAAQGVGPLPLLIVADEQTAGRGRGSNRWWTGKGSLACSLLVDLDDGGFEPRCTPLVSLASAVAIARTAQRRLPSHTVGVHWPNDVFVAGRKLAGVLVEVLADRRVIVGIGLNTNNALRDAPPPLRKTATTLRELTGAPHDHTEILLELLAHLADGLGQLTSAPEQIAAAANALCSQRGGTLAIQSGRRLVRGRCLGIDADGGLLLETAGGRRTLYSGVVREATTCDPAAGLSAPRDLKTRPS